MGKTLKIAGFLGDISREAEASVTEKADPVFAFDSGAGLSMKDLQAHVMATGITGAGKTISVGAPLLEGALRQGCAAFIADHKGNLRKIARKICRLVGREADIREYGTGELAIPSNLLPGMPLHRARSLFSMLMRRVFQGRSGNMDFHEKGVDTCTDIVKLLRFLHGFRPQPFSGSQSRARLRDHAERESRELAI